MRFESEGAVSGDHEQHPAEPFFAFIYNAAGVPVAAGELYPAFLLLPPIIAAAAMASSSASAIGNAARLD